MHRRLLPALLLFVILTSCTSLAGQDLPTLFPTDHIPTAIARTQTVLAAETLFAAALTSTDQPIPQAATPTATRMLLLTGTPVDASTPTPVLLPDSMIQIQSPGPMSRATSPIKVSLHIITGHQQKFRLELFGEDGRLLARQISSAYSSRKWATVFLDIPFEITAAAEVARLQVSTEDERGRLVALSSVRLILMSSGFPEINPAEPIWERCILTTPLPETGVTGGMLIVDGRFRPLNEQPLIIELTTIDGAIIATRLVYLAPALGDVYVPFATSVPYTVIEPISVRLSVRQQDDRIAGTAYLYSQLITISP